MKQQQIRTLWVSDTHLGNKNAQAEALMDFLQQHECETLYLVGDILDLWKMSKKGHWPKSHQQVLSLIMDKAKDCTTRYIPGNHDPFFRQLDQQCLGDIKIHKEYIHQLANGKQLLVTHGDCFDEQISKHPWLFIIGDLSYNLAVNLNRHINQLGRALGFSYWSLPSFLKRRSKKAHQYIEQFERLAIARAKELNLDGIVCGHIHQAKLMEVEGIIYANDGDWLEGCHALVEHMDGSLAIVHWASSKKRQSKRLVQLLPSNN